jgi:hypothetical protein
MKRLMDDAPSGLERSLLQVGQQVGSSEHGKAKLLATVAAGSLIGAGATQAATASKAWGAWLGSSAGKAGLIATLVVSAGGGGYWAHEQLWPSKVDGRVTTVGGAAAGIAPVNSEPVSGAPAERSPEQVAPAPVALENTREPSAEANDPAAARVLRAASVNPSHATSGVQRSAVQASPRSLVEETALIEQLRGAVEQHDRNLAESLSRRYWQRFSAGQLGPEARRLDTRWRDLPRSR